MQNLGEGPLEVAERIRQLASGITDPADVAVIESYARTVEVEARRAETKPLFRPDDEPAGSEA